MSDPGTTYPETVAITSIAETLRSLTVDTEPVFRAVRICDAFDGARQRFFTQSRLALIRYTHTEQISCPDDVTMTSVALELLLADRITGDGDDESRIVGIVTLTRQAKDAIAAAPPTGAQGFSDGKRIEPALAFDEPRIDLTCKRPWIAAKLPLRVGFVA